MTAEQEEKAIALSEQKVSVRKIEKELGVSKSSIQRLLAAVRAERNQARAQDSAEDSQPSEVSSQPDLLPEKKRDFAWVWMVLVFLLLGVAIWFLLFRKKGH